MTQTTKVTFGTSKLSLALSGLAATTLAGCGSGGGGGSSGSTAPAATSSAASPDTTSATAPAAPSITTSAPGTPAVGGPAPVVSSSSGFPAAADNDPSWYTTPTVAGLGARTITVTPGSSPTLQDALDGARPGDVIELASGLHVPTTYNTLLMTSSGNGSSWIAIRPAAGAQPVVDLQNTGEFRISGSYILVEGLEIKNGKGNNVHVCPTASSVSHVVVRNCRVHHLASEAGAAVKINSDNSVGGSCSYVYVEGCDLTDAIENSTLDCVGVSRCVARHNDVHDNQYGMHGLFYKGGSSDILIEENLVRGIRANAAFQLGGNTEKPYFTPAHPDQEGVNFVIRNNVIADCDDSVFEVRGIDGARTYNSTIITQTSYVIFRFQYGSSSSGSSSIGANFGSSSSNHGIDIANNLVIATGGSPRYMANDANEGAWTFGPQLWAGSFTNETSNGGTSLPRDGDVVAAASAEGGVVASPSYSGLAGLDDARARFQLHVGSPALGAGAANTVAPRDMLDQPRHATSPSIGAFE